MLRAYRRCEEKRLTRLEILLSLTDMSGDKPASIATLRQTQKPTNGNASPPFRDFIEYPNFRIIQGAQGGA